MYQCLVTRQWKGIPQLTHGSVSAVYADFRALYRTKIHVHRTPPSKILFRVFQNNLRALSSRFVPKIVEILLHPQ